MLPTLLALVAAATLLGAALLAAMLLPFTPSSALRESLPPKGRPLLGPRGALRPVASRIPDRAWILAPAVSAALFLAGAHLGFAPLPADGSLWTCAREYGHWVPPQVLTAWTPALAIVFGTFALLFGVVVALLHDDPHDPRPANMLLSAVGMVVLGWAMTFTAYLGSLLPCA